MEGIWTVVAREVECTNEFADWWATLEESEQDDIVASVELPREYGPGLGFPLSSGNGGGGSRHEHMRELRVQSGEWPVRVACALDPRRTAILLIAGDKTGDGRFCKRFVPLADLLHDERLRELKELGKIRWLEITHFPD